MSSTDISPSTTPNSAQLLSSHVPKFGTVIPSRIFVGGIASNSTESELKQFFSAFGVVKDTKIIADRAGVSKGYGFVTFENQEDADRIIKKEADNLVFKDRKLNIGPAVRKQSLPRPYDANLAPGSVVFTNGMPYAYHNGMAFFPQVDGSFNVNQAQPSYAAAAAVMMPQSQTLYMAPTQYSYPTVPSAQWPAAQPAQWRWGTQIASQQAIANNPSYVWTALPAGSELMYSQPAPAQAFQTEIDSTFVDGTPVEGSVIPVDQSMSSRIHTPATDINSHDPSLMPAMSVIPVAAQHTKAGSMLANYKKPYSLTRRSFNTPTILVKHGHKVQRVMVTSNTPTPMYNGQVINHSDVNDDGYMRYAQIQGLPTSN